MAWCMQEPRQSPLLLVGTGYIVSFYPGPGSILSLCLPISHPTPSQPCTLYEGKLEVIHSSLWYLFCRDVSKASLDNSGDRGSKFCDLDHQKS